MRDIAPYARAAFANGVAASGGPITDRVRAGCIAAVEYACEHFDDRDVLEVTLRLGHLEGVWALVFDRRDKLIAAKTKTVLAAWRKTVERLDVAAMIRRYRHEMRLQEATARQQSLRDQAKREALNLLEMIPATGAWQDLRTAMRDAVKSGRAEGYADAIALAAEAEGRIGYDFDLAFDHAYDALANLGETWADADVWLERMLAREADQLGGALAALAGDGASYEEMLAAAGDILDGVEGDAVGFITDWALSTGMARGALDLYGSEGVTGVDWMTAGDLRVCAVCNQNESGSPWPINEFPTQPSHPSCRCAMSANFNLSDSYSGLFASA